MLTQKNKQKQNDIGKCDATKLTKYSLFFKTGFQNFQKQRIL